MVFFPKIQFKEENNEALIVRLNEQVAEFVLRHKTMPIDRMRNIVTNNLVKHYPEEVRSQWGKFRKWCKQGRLEYLIVHYNGSVEVDFDFILSVRHLGFDKAYAKKYYFTIMGK